MGELSLLLSVVKTADFNWDLIVCVEQEEGNARVFINLKDSRKTEVVVIGETC